MCVMVVCGGYGEGYEKGLGMRGIEEGKGGGSMVLDGGRGLKEGEVVSGGGGVIGVRC